MMTVGELVMVICCSDDCARIPFTAEYFLGLSASLTLRHMASLSTSSWGAIIINRKSPLLQRILRKQI